MRIRDWKLCFLAAAILAASCGGTKPHPISDKPVVRTPEPALPSKPDIGLFTVDPPNIEKGQSATLRWSVSGATDMNIDHGIGAVQSSGTRTVSPDRSTTYTLSVTGPGGTSTMSATLDVRIPLTTPTNPNDGGNTRSSIDNRPPAQALEQDALDAFFDYDSTSIRSDARDALTKDADLLKRIIAAHPNFQVVLEGHCDERGSAEYNLGLGDNRAVTARDFIVQLGVPADHLQVVSYGKDKPQCTDPDEACYQKNRRVHLSSR